MKALHAPRFEAPEAIIAGLAEQQYVASPRIATAVYLGMHLEKPLLVEGPAGVGKTELAKALTQMLGVPLVRLQCYEGLDEAKALYGSAVRSPAARAGRAAAVAAREKPRSRTGRHAPEASPWPP